MKPGDILVKEFGDMTSVYCYNFHDEPLTVNLGSKKGAGVKHIFTGPYEGLKIEATGLFSQIQEGIELRWQGVRTGIAEGFSTNSNCHLRRYAYFRVLCLGPYYSWESPRHGWVDSEIPRCIHQAQKLISKLVSNYGEKEPGDEHGVYETLREEKPGPSTSSEGMIKKDDQAAENVRINHVVALAWTASGSKRVRIGIGYRLLFLVWFRLLYRVLSYLQRIVLCSSSASGPPWNLIWSDVLQR